MSASTYFEPLDPVWFEKGEFCEIAGWIARGGDVNSQVNMIIHLHISSSSSCAAAVVSLPSSRAVAAVFS